MTLDIALVAFRDFVHLFTDLADNSSPDLKRFWVTSANALTTCVDPPWDEFRRLFGEDFDEIRPEGD